MRFWRRRLMLRWLVPAFAGLAIAAPASAGPLLLEEGLERSSATGATVKRFPVADAPALRGAPVDAPGVDRFGWSEGAIAAGVLSLLVAATGTIVVRRRPALSQA